jgi:Bacterial TSP3 repeat
MYDGTTAGCTVSGTVTTLTLSSITRAVTFKVFETSSPAGVENNGLRLPHLLSQSSFDNSTSGWFYDGTAQFLYIKIAHPGGNTSVSFGTDSVGDGVTDSWRSFYGITDDNADSDGDGLTNAQEYFAGTNPNSAQSSFGIQSVTPQSGGFLVSWQSQPGIVYQVQWKNALTDSSWMSITPDITGDGSLLNWTDDGTQTGGLATSRFYRIAIP